MYLSSSFSESANYVVVVDLVAAAAATRFSRCFSTRESAKPVATQLHHRWCATLLRPQAAASSLVFAVVSDCRAAASAAVKKSCC